MLKFIHAADFHLDSPFSGLSPELATRRRSEQRLLLNDLTDLVLREQADLVLLSGDILDSGMVYRETVQALEHALARMACPVFIAPGNHDPNTPDSLWRTRSWPKNVHIFSGTVEKYELPALNCVVYGYGYPATHVETSPLEGFLVGEGRDTVKLMCLHADLTPNSPYAPITRQQIAGSGLTYLALGHIHAGSGLQRAGATFYAYPGCPQGRGYDETGEKGVLVVTAEPGRVDSSFVPLCRQRYESLTVDVTGQDPFTAVTAALPAGSGELACRITLTGESAGADLSALRAALESRCAALSLTDSTHLPLNLWKRREEDNLTGMVLDDLFRRCQAEPDNETLRLAARFALAALEGGEDAAP